MQVAIESATVIVSRHGGEVVRLSGRHVNEFGKLTAGYCFIDPRNDNWSDWESVLDTVARNRGHWVILDHVKMFNREKGLWNADSRPAVIDIAIKQKENV